MISPYLRFRVSACQISPTTSNLPSMPAIHLYLLEQVLLKLSKIGERHAQVSVVQEVLTNIPLRQQWKAAPDPRFEEFLCRNNIGKAERSTRFINKIVLA